MPDLSAGRPLPLPEKQFTAEEVEELAEVIFNSDGDNAGPWTEYPEDVRKEYRVNAQAALEHLAARSRLLPPSAEHREEWTVRYTNLAGVRKEASAVFDGSQGAAGVARSIERDPRCSDPVLVRRTVIDFVGSWVEVDRSKAE